MERETAVGLDAGRVWYSVATPGDQETNRLDHPGQTLDTVDHVLTHMYPQDVDIDDTGKNRLRIPVNAVSGVGIGPHTHTNTHTHTHGKERQSDGDTRTHTEMTLA